jgi:hypothetical protein
MTYQETTLKLIDEAIEHWTKRYNEANCVWVGSFGKAAIVKIQTLQAIKESLTGDFVNLERYSELWLEDDLMKGYDKKVFPPWQSVESEGGHTSCSQEGLQ